MFKEKMFIKGETYTEPTHLPNHDIMSRVLMEALANALSTNHSFSEYEGKLNVLRGFDGMYIYVTEDNANDKLLVHYPDGSSYTVYITDDLEETIEDAVWAIEAYEKVSTV